MRTTYNNTTIKKLKDFNNEEHYTLSQKEINDINKCLNKLTDMLRRLS